MRVYVAGDDNGETGAAVAHGHVLDRGVLWAAVLSRLTDTC